MVKTVKTTDYKALSEELAAVMARLEQGDLDIDEAVTCYARGVELVKLLEAHLQQAENKVTKLKASISGEAGE